MDKHLHIISFDVPYPPNYGGIIDVFYKLKSLSELGVKVHLHAFAYKNHNQANTRLEELCEEVTYYDRKSSIAKFIFDSDPFIVSSRKNRLLLKNLMKDNHPILFEGIHTTAFLNHDGLKDRFKLVRAHNIEQDYYAELGRVASGSKAIYYKKEAKRLAAYEPVLRNADVILSISKDDVGHFKGYSKTAYISAFYNNEKDALKFDSDPVYVLFHGNLGVNENELAANKILDALGDKIKAHIVIAGSNPSKGLIQKIANCKNAKIVANPTIKIMDGLIQNAQINVLYAEKPSGVKLKLINSLNLGKHVIINSSLNDGSLFQDICTVSELELMEQEVQRLLEIPFSKELETKRNTFMRDNFNNLVNAQKILDFI